MTYIVLKAPLYSNQPTIQPTSQLWTGWLCWSKVYWPHAVADGK